MTDDIKRDSASALFIKAANVNVAEDGNNVAVRVTFFKFDQYAQAREILERLDGWKVAEGTELDGKLFNLKASVENTNVPTVADRLRQVGISTLKPRPA